MVSRCLAHSGAYPLTDNLLIYSVHYSHGLVLTSCAKLMMQMTSIKDCNSCRTTYETIGRTDGGL